MTNIWYNFKFNFVKNPSIPFVVVFQYMKFVKKCKIVKAHIYVIELLLRSMFAKFPFTTHLQIQQTYESSISNLYCKIYSQFSSVQFIPNFLLVVDLHPAAPYIFVWWILQGVHQLRCSPFLSIAWFKMHSLELSVIKINSLYAILVSCKMQRKNWNEFQSIEEK